MQDCLKEKLVEEQKYRNHLLIEYLHATKQQEQQTMPGKVDAVENKFHCFNTIDCFFDSV